MRAPRPSAPRHLLAASLLVAVGVLAGCGGAASATPQAPPSFADAPSDDGQLHLPPADTTVGFRERALAQFRDFPQYGGTAVNRDHTRLTIRWHGEVPDALRQVIDDYALRVSSEIVIEDTEFMPGDLRAEADRLLREHAPVIQDAGPRPAGDGVDVTVSSQAVQAAGSAEAALEDNGVVSDYPIFVISVGDIEPA